MSLTLIPAYGRDYKTQKEVISDWKAGKDFIVANLFSPWDGKLCNLQDIKNEGKEKNVMIRFSRLQKLVFIKI